MNTHKRARAHLASILPAAAAPPPLSSKRTRSPSHGCPHVRGGPLPLGASGRGVSGAHTLARPPLRENSCPGSPSRRCLGKGHSAEVSCDGQGCRQTPLCMIHLWWSGAGKGRD